MGEVFLARDDQRRTVAVKVIRPELASGKAFRNRFRREVDAARAVSGTYTASVLDADPDGPVPWLATTHILGPTLAEAVEAYGPLPPRTVLALGAGLAEALIAVHSAGLVHRDLKPSNVLLSAEGPRVIDFGIVRATDGYELTLSGVLLGSPRYMCPEHATGDPMGPAGDVFCLGSVLAYAATGKAPFDGASAATLLYQVVHGVPDLTGVQEPLDTIIRLCLEKSPTARPSPDRVSAACAPGGADAVDWEGWLPEPVLSAIGRQAAALMDLDHDLDLGAEARADVRERETARAGAAAAPARARLDPRVAISQRLVTERPSSPQPVAFPELPELPDLPEHLDLPDRPKPGPTHERPSAQPPPPAQPPERGTHRARRPLRSTPSRRSVLATAALALGGGLAALLHGSKDEPSRVAAPAGRAPEPLWTYRTIPLVQAPAVLYNGTALLKTQSGALVSLGLADGSSPRWTYQGISQSPTPPLLTSDAVVALGTGATVIGVDPVTGVERFSLDFGSGFRFDTLLGGVGDQVTIIGLRFSSPDGSQGAATSTNVVLGTDLGARLARVIPIDAQDIGLDLKPVIDSSHFVYMDGLHRLTARDTAGRSNVLWTQRMASDSEITSAPVLFDGTVYAADNELLAVDLETGELRWRVKEEKGGFASVAVVDGTVYCTTRDPHGVQAFDAASGARRWFRETPRLDLENPVVAGRGAVFVTAAANKDGFYALDTRQGDLLWNFTDGRDTGINDWQLSCDTTSGAAADPDHPLIAQHFDRVYAIPMPRH